MFSTPKSLGALILILTHLCWSVNSYALPVIKEQFEGNGWVSIPDSKTMNFEQKTDKWGVNFYSIKIKTDETVNLYQPSATSIALFRDVGQDPSEIFGSLNANGRLFLVNKNGILFGRDSHVNVGGLLATSSDIRNEDFHNGIYRFSGTGGLVENLGKIAASPGGFVLLLGSSAHNGGTIEAPLGIAALASGKQIDVLNLDSHGIISIKVNPHELTDRKPTGQTMAVNNSGKISANGGRVVLDAQVIKGVFAQAINNTGVIEAKTLDNHGGLVTINSNDNVAIKSYVLSENGAVGISGRNITIDNAIINSSHSNVATGRASANNLVNIDAQESLVMNHSVVNANTQDRADSAITGIDLTGKKINLSNDTSIQAVANNASASAKVSVRAKSTDQENAVVNLTGTGILAVQNGPGVASVEITADHEAKDLSGTSIINMNSSSASAKTLGEGVATTNITAHDTSVLKQEEVFSQVNLTNSRIESNSKNTAKVSLEAKDEIVGADHRVVKNEGAVTLDQSYVQNDNSGKNSSVSVTAGGLVDYSKGTIRGNTNKQGDQGEVNIKSVSNDIKLGQTSGRTIDISAGGNVSGDDINVTALTNHVSNQGKAVVDISAGKTVDLKRSGIGAYSKDRVDSSDVQVNLAGQDISLDRTMLKANVDAVNPDSYNKTLVGVNATSRNSQDAQIVLDQSGIESSVTGGRGDAVLALGANHDAPNSDGTYQQGTSRILINNNSGLVAKGQGSGKYGLVSIVAKDKSSSIEGTTTLVEINKSQVYAASDAAAIIDIRSLDTAMQGKVVDGYDGKVKVAETVVKTITPKEQGLIQVLSGGDINLSSSTMDSAGKVRISSYQGNLELGKIMASIAMLTTGAQQAEFPIIRLSDRGDIRGHDVITAKELYFSGPHHIGTAANPLKLNVDTVSGLSWDRGDIYLDSQKGITLGSYKKINDNAYEGVSLAANEGKVWVNSTGDITVNSIVTPQGGVYLNSAQGSIYAGHGWNPARKGSVDPTTFPLTNDKKIAGVDYFVPEMAVPAASTDGANIIAGGYSYISAPQGTIGNGTPASKVGGLNADIKGIVRPSPASGSPAPAVEFAQGNVYYQDADVLSGTTHVAPATVNGDPQLIFNKPGVPAVNGNNPLKVHIEAGPSSLSAVPEGIFPTSGLTLRSGAASNINPTPTPTTGANLSGLLSNTLNKETRFYEQIITNHRVRSEAVLPLFYAYHPLTPTDTSAFDTIQLDPDAYEYIDGNININGPLSPFYQDEEQVKKKKTVF